MRFPRATRLSPVRPRAAGFRFEPWLNQSSYLELVADIGSGGRSFVDAAARPPAGDCCIDQIASRELASTDARF